MLWAIYCLGMSWACGRAGEVGGTYSDVLREVEGMAESAAPQLLSLTSAGKTVEGRDVMLALLSPADLSESGGCGTLLLVAAQHGGDRSAVSMLVSVLGEVLQSQEEEMLYLKSHRRLAYASHRILPVLNVDAYTAALQTDILTESRYRKNRRPGNCSEA